MLCKTLGSRLIRKFQSLPLSNLENQRIYQGIICPVSSKQVFANDIQKTLSKNFHTSSILEKYLPQTPNWYKERNTYRFPIQQPEEEKRSAYVCNVKGNVKGSEKKFWYYCMLVRGMKIDDAINQLKFIRGNKAPALIELLEETRDMAIKDHNVEFPSNLWVSEARVTRGYCIKGIRRHARRRIGIVEYKYSHLFVTLEEGDPPEHFYYHRRRLTPEEQLGEWIENLRKRKPELTL